jgi:hypothetical protein
MNLCETRGNRRFKMQFQRVLPIRQRFLLRFALGGEINLQALRDVPFAFPPHRSRKWAFHSRILPYLGPQSSRISGVPGAEYS